MNIIGDYKFFAGIDPGHHGAVAVINATGTTFRFWKMPMQAIKDELDLAPLRDIFKYLRRLPGCVVGIEWPTAWPGAFNNVIRDAEVFGRQKGMLEAYAFLHGLEYRRLTPQAWKGKLALDGKTRVGANERAAALWDALYPAAAASVRGPRGGVLDGLLDAGLIAHYLRLISGAIAATATRGSVEHLAAVLGAGPGKRRFCRPPTKL